MFSAVAMFRRAGTSPDPREPTTALAFDGPYRFTRNPMYLGMALILGGLALVGNALWPLIAVVLAVWIIRTQVIDREERYLEAKFGGAYRDFKSRVRRWI
jgi:protein-S-isoprenylcysteine O-methyltransferase Ste14